MSYRIAVCPDCDGNLQPDGVDSYWCTYCQQAVSFARAILLTCAGGQ